MVVVHRAPARQPSLDSPKSPDMSDDEIVTIRPIPNVNDPTQKELRFSCPDATGLGCDVTRMLLDFGLRILEGDVSTDGQWCFLIFKLQLSRGVPARWALLKKRLEKISPAGAQTVPTWHNRRASEEFRSPHLLQVSSYDRSGFLHDLIHTLWESELVIFKAHITTAPGGKVLDMFWVYDHRAQLPDTHRVLQIREMVRECLGQQDAECSIAPAPEDTFAQDSASAMIKRCACADTEASLPLRRLLSVRRRKEQVTLTSEIDEYGDPEEVQVTVDNCTTAAYSLLNVVCQDRKGLVYDLMRTLKDTHIRVAYAKVATHHDKCEMDLFVQEVGGKCITDRELQEELVERIRLAVLLPFQISIKDIFDDTCTELLVTANLDSGGRGRPRVTFDVTSALATLDLCVYMADMFIEVLPSDSERRPLEMHRFLLQQTNGRKLESPDEHRRLYARVRAQLTGLDDVEVTAQRQPSAAETVFESLECWKWSGSISPRS